MPVACMCPRGFTMPETTARGTVPLAKAEKVSKVFHKPLRHVAVDEVSLEIDRGDIVALVGESGSGKSTVGRILVRLVDPSSGTVRFDGEDIFRFRRNSLRKFRRRAQIVFQNPYMSLNPRMRVGAALGEVVKLANGGEDPTTEVRELLEGVRLPASYAKKYPHELSGGERQRVAIARVMAVKPEFLVADEVVSALDVAVGAEVVNVLLDLNQQGLACLFITHDLHLARVVADRVLVMHRGSIVERGPPAKIFESPEHEYTKALVDAQLIPSPHAE